MESEPEVYEYAANITPHETKIEVAMVSKV